MLNEVHRYRFYHIQTDTFGPEFVICDWHLRLQVEGEDLILVRGSQRAQTGCERCLVRGSAGASDAVLMAVL